MSDYRHDHKDSNLSGAHKALKYDKDGEPSLRVSIENIEENAGAGTGLSTNRYSRDAWGRPKSVLDYSIFSATWTFDVPERVWMEVSWDYINEIPMIQPTLSKVSSVDHMMSVLSGTSAGNGTVGRTRSFMRYQPNRGQLFSTAITCPNPTFNGSREWGLSTADNGVMFELLGDGADWDLVVTRRKNGSVVETTSIKDAVLERFPDFDASKGHVYDIQYEWRGVGNYYFFVNLELVYTMELLGTLDSISIDNPALPVAFVSTTFTEGSEIELFVSCVDVTSEGGQDERTVYGTIDSGDTFTETTDNQYTINGSDRYIGAVLALRVPRTIQYNGETEFNTRGVILDALSSWTDAPTFITVYAYSDQLATNLMNNVTWTQATDSNVEYAVGGNNSQLEIAHDLDKAYAVRLGSKGNGTIDNSNVEIRNHSKNSDFVVNPGDIVVIVTNTALSKKQHHSSLAFSEQI